MDEKEKKEYELAVLVKDEGDLAAVTTLVRQHNGEASSDFKAKRLGLAYEIKKHNEAIFAYGNFKALPVDAKELEAALNTKAEVIRFLMLASPAPSMPLDRQAMPMGGGVKRRSTRVMRPAAQDESKPAPSKPLSNEALEKKIEEILK